MNELILVNGRFPAAAADQLLTRLVAVKTVYHTTCIQHDTEEAIKHSEMRIRELEEGLRSLLAAIRNAKSGAVDIEAVIKVTEKPGSPDV